ASEVKKGDRFYYEEILVTSDPKYAGGETAFTKGYGNLNVIAKHTGENPDQTVLIAKNKAELTLSKEAIGAADKADGNVTFRVSCDDGTAATLYAPARGGVANTNPAWAGYQASSIEVTPGAICTVEETY
ncbi:hypothetical protein FYZ39_12745, partial [Mobiluncus curtisii]